jgi:hypothetical protein
MGVFKFLKKTNIFFSRYEILREIVISIIFGAIASVFVNIISTNYSDAKISYRQFIYEFSRTFTDTPKYRNITSALEDQYLYGNTKLLTTVSDYDLDDYIGLLNTMWNYYKDGYISKDLINDEYGYYYCIVYKSNFVKNYRNRLKQIGFSYGSSYGFLDEVQKELNPDNLKCEVL